MTACRHYALNLKHFRSRPANFPGETYFSIGRYRGMALAGNFDEWPNSAQGTDVMVNEKKNDPSWDPDADLKGQSRALVVISEPLSDVSRGGAMTRPLSSFLAQLIATRHLAPQTRSKRRVRADVAANAYGGRLIVRSGREREGVSWSI
jgi:hypothetical protein